MLLLTAATSPLGDALGATLPALQPALWERAFES
jgi:hypothetical protein